MNDDDEEEPHYHDHSGPNRTCLQCREGLKRDLVIELANSLDEGNSSGGWERMMRAIDSILDEWPR